MSHCNIEVTVGDSPQFETDTISLIVSLKEKHGPPMSIDWNNLFFSLNTQYTIYIICCYSYCFFLTIKGDKRFVALEVV